MLPTKNMLSVRRLPFPIRIRAYVSEHLNRLHKRRTYEEEAGINGKKFFGATGRLVWGMIFGRGRRDLYGLECVIHSRQPQRLDHSVVRVYSGAFRSQIAAGNVSVRSGKENQRLQRA